MTNEELRAIALEVAKELLDEPLNIGQAEHYTDFATRFLAAITARAEPHSYMVNGEWMKKLPPPPFVNGGTRVVELFTNPAINAKAEPVVDPNCTCDEHGACAYCWNGKKHDTHPAIEPASPLTFDGMTAHQFALNELHKFQEMTGCDIAEEITPWSTREIELFDGMIEVQKTHAETCDRIPNRVMAEKQKGWDLERVALLEKCKALYQKG